MRFRWKYRTMYFWTGIATLGFLALCAISLGAALLLPGFADRRPDWCYVTDALFVYVECGPETPLRYLFLVFFNIFYASLIAVFALSNGAKFGILYAIVVLVGIIATAALLRFLVNRDWKPKAEKPGWPGQ